MGKRKEDVCFKKPLLNSDDILNFIERKLNSSNNVLFIDSMALDVFMRRKTLSCLSKIKNFNNNWNIIIVLIYLKKHWSFAIYYKNIYGYFFNEFIHYDSILSYHEEFFEEIAKQMISLNLIPECKYSVSKNWLLQESNWECGYICSIGIYQSIRVRHKLLISKKKFKGDIIGYIQKKFPK